MIQDKIRITVDPKGEHFLMYTPYFMNGVAQKAPNRRFLKSQKAWFLNGLSLNAKYIKNLQGVQKDKSVDVLIEKILAKSRCTFTPFPINYKFKPDMMPKSKQIEALNHAWGKPGNVFDMEMGTGKTKIYIDLTSALFLDGKIDAVVLLTKKTICDNTIKEIYKHCPLTEYQTHTPEYTTKAQKTKNQKFLEDKSNFKFLVAGVESLSTGVKSGKAFYYLWEFLKYNRSAMVVDECHLIKNPGAQRSKNVFELATMADFRYAGTGTLLTNNLLDIFSPFQFINPDILGIDNFFAFKNRYTIKGGFQNKEIIGYDNVEELMSLIKPWCFQATKAEMVDLPPKIYMEPILIPMTKEQQKVYQDIKKNKMTMVDELEDKRMVVQSVLQVYSLLQQICAGFLSYTDDDGKRQTKWIVEPDENPKYKELLAILDENPNTQFNIWTRHLKELHAVYDILSKKDRTVKLHGAMSTEERKQAIHDFTSKKAKYMIATQETGGTGLTFTNCSYVIYLSNSFNYGNRIQSEDRNHRIGTVNPVTYIDLVMKDSVEQRVLEVLSNKKSLAEYVKQELRDTGVPPID